MVPLLNFLGIIVFLAGVALWGAILMSGLACWQGEGRPPEEPESRPAPPQNREQPSA